MAQSSQNTPQTAGTVSGFGNNAADAAGRLPSWAWPAIGAAVVLAVVFFFMKKKG